MSGFTIDEGACGAGTGSYEAGLVTLSDGATLGVEDIARLTVREDGGRKGAASRAVPGFLGSLRGVLPAAAGLSMPVRLAVSTVRAGLGVIEEGLAPESTEPLPVEIAFADGKSVVARMPPGLIAVIRQDRQIALGALARAFGSPTSTAEEATAEIRDPTEALTSIFRYEKRNGRLRRVAEPDPPSET